MTNTETRLYTRMSMKLREFKMLSLWLVSLHSQYKKLRIKVTDGFYDIDIFKKYYPGRRVTQFTEELESEFREKRKDLMLDAEKKEKNG